MRALRKQKRKHTVAGRATDNGSINNCADDEGRRRESILGDGSNSLDNRQASDSSSDPGDDANLDRGSGIPQIVNHSYEHQHDNVLQGAGAGVPQFMRGSVETQSVGYSSNLSFRSEGPGRRRGTSLTGLARPAESSPPLTNEVPASSVETHISSLAPSAIVQTVTRFTSMYPELRMIHLPTLLKGFRVSPGADAAESQRTGRQESYVLVASMLAACPVSVRHKNDDREKELLARTDYENYAEQRLSTLVFSHPHIQVAQALLIMAVLKGNLAEFHKAWMYCGTWAMSHLHHIVSPCWGRG